MIHKNLIAFFILIQSAMFAQIGGTKTYRFLDIPMTARAAALGGNSMGIYGNDLNLIYNAPSALNAGMHKQIALNYCNYVGDLNFGYIAYAHDLKKKGTVAGGIQFLDYGKFQGYDEFGNTTNNFKANDYSINLHYARPFEDTSFQIGIALKTIISKYDIYRSFGNALDFGFTYHNAAGLAITLQAKNVGVIWKDYFGKLAKSEALPQTVQLGLSYRVPKAPFRLVGSYDQITRWNLKYISPLDTSGQSNPFDNGTAVKDSSGFQKFGKRFGNGADNFFRHITVGTEILLHENFMLRIAYNHRRQREMLLPERRGANGLSVGFGFKIKRFAFGFAFTKMAAAGNAVILNVGWQL